MNSLQKIYFFRAKRSNSWTASDLSEILIFGIIKARFVRRTFGENFNWKNRPVTIEMLDLDLELELENVFEI